MKTASAETRARVVKAYTSGVATRKQLAEIFGYHIQSIGNWIREYEREGRIASHPKGHRISVFSPEEREQLIVLLKSRVDMTLAEIKDHFGKNCCLAAIHRIVVGLGFVVKKNTQGKRTRTRRYPPQTQ
jgi:transposase